VDAARRRPAAVVHEGLAVLPLAGPGRRGDRYRAPDAVILARRLDPGEARSLILVRNAPATERGGRPE
jgi:hypothetical protein